MKKFKKRLKKIKKDAKVKANKISTSNKTRSFLKQLTKKVPPSFIKESRSTKKVPSWMPKNMRKVIEAKKSTKKRTPKDGTKFPMPFGPSMVFYKGKPIPKSKYEIIIKAKRTPSKKMKTPPKGYKYVRKGPFGIPKLVKAKPKVILSKPRNVVRAGPREIREVVAKSRPKPITGPRGKTGRRGYPGARGRTGARGPPGQSIASTERWKHKLEKDRLMRAYRNQQRLGRERNQLERAKVAEMKKRNAILTQRISEQELMAQERMNNASMYTQWKSLKEATQETIFPNLGGIDIEDEHIASSISALPWLILGIALITREG